MEGLARRAGDLDALVSVKSRDLSSPYRFYEIARLYRDAGDHDRALEWAERGTAAFPAEPDWRLQELLADEYHRRSRHADAMGLAWRHFADRPFLDSYEDLKRHAELAADWPAWRLRVLSHLGHGAGSEPRPGRDRSMLVDILLWEGDVEDAWREASTGGCSDDLWMRLATERQVGHPGDVIPIYRRLAEQAVNRKDNRSYAEAVGLMKKVREAMRRLGDQAGFRAYVEQVRAAHRPKRNFMRLLDAERW